MPQKPDKTSIHAISTISVLGATLTGVGILLYIASNWSAIPNAGRLAIIFSSLLVFYAAGFYFHYERAAFPGAGAGLILLGSLIFGAGIFLIARMYNFPVDYHSGMLLWGLAVLPLAYLLGLNTLLSLAIVALLFWLGMEASFSRQFMISGLTAFVTLFLMAGITVWALGLLHSGFAPLARLSGPYLNIGLFLTLASGYVLTYTFLGWNFGSPAFHAFYTGMTILFTASLALFVIKGKKDHVWVNEVVLLAALFLIVLLLSLNRTGGPDSAEVMEATEYAQRNQQYPLLRIGVNVLFAIQVVGVIALGYFRQNRAYVNLGLLFLMLGAFARYYDFFWQLMPRSFFFIGGGLLLIVCAIVLEKKRRSMLASFNPEAG